MRQVASIYRGTVFHRRWRPRRHQLSYRVFNLLLDIDRIEETARRLKLFSCNAPGVVSFHDKDHGAPEKESLRGWLSALLGEHGIEIGSGRILLLAYPRILGRAFNPLSVYFCHREAGDLAAIVYEVHNTFGERHFYVAPCHGDRAGEPEVCRHEAAKEFHVSPFIEMQATYHFRTTPPGDTTSIAIREAGRDGPVLDASFSGRAAPLTDLGLLHALITYPLMAIKVIAGIHWEALKLWKKGIRVFSHPGGHAANATLAAPDRLKRGTVT